MVNIHKTQKGSGKVVVMSVFSFAFLSLLFSHLYPLGVLLTKAVCILPAICGSTPKQNIKLECLVNNSNYTIKDHFSSVSNDLDTCFGAIFTIVIHTWLTNKRASSMRRYWKRCQLLVQQTCSFQSVQSSNRKVR